MGYFNFFFEKMNFIFFLLPLLCSASLIPDLKDVSKINATSLISSLSDANPDDVMQVRDLIAAGETDRNTATTARDDAQGEADAAGTALQDATDTHTQTAGELVACEEEEARLTLLEDEKRNAKEAADAAKAAASAALAAAQDHLDSETARLDGERETLERILELLDTLLPATSDYSRIAGCTARMFGHSIGIDIPAAIGFRHNNLIIFAAIEEPYLKVSSLDQNGNWAGGRYIVTDQLSNGGEDQITSEFVENVWIAGHPDDNHGYEIDSLSGC